MKSELKRISSCEQELSFTIPADEMTAAYEKLLADSRKMAAVPGFRPGKAPLHMVERLYGAALKKEFIQEKLEEYYKQALNDTNAEPITPGDPVDFSWDNGKDFTASFKFETVPQFEITTWEKLEVPFAPKELTQQDIDRYMEELRQRNGYYQDSDEPASEQTLVKTTLILNGLNEKPLDRDITPGANPYGEEFNRDLLGKKAGEEFDTTMNTGKTPRPVHVKVLNVQKLILPELDDEMARDLECENLEDLLNKVKTNLQNETDAENRAAKKAAVYRAIIAANPFEVPQSQVISLAKHLAEPFARRWRIPEEKAISLYKPSAEFQVKEYYIQGRMADMLGIAPTDADRDAVIAEAAKNMDMSPEEYREKYAPQLEGEDFAAQVKEFLLYNRLESVSKFVEPTPEAPATPDVEAEAEELEELLIEPEKE